MSSTWVMPSAASPGRCVDRRLERALLGERPDVQLVDHRVLQLRAAVPAAVGPREAPRVDDARRPAQALGLPPARAGRAAPGRRARRRSRRRRRPRRARCGCRGPRGEARGPRRARGRRRARGAGPRRGTRPSRRRLGPPPARAPRGTRLRTSRPHVTPRPRGTNARLPVASAACCSSATASPTTRRSTSPSATRCSSAPPRRRSGRCCASTGRGPPSRSGAWTLCGRDSERRSRRRGRTGSSR